MLLDTISTWIGGKGTEQVHECRHCGETVASGAEQCPHCGPDAEIVTYDLE